MEAPKGYRFAAVAANFRGKNNGRLDLGAVLSDTPAVAAGVFTTNLFKAAPVIHAQRQLAECAQARAVVINSGQANACTGAEGEAQCRESMEIVAEAFGLKPSDILPASTGVIAQTMNMDRWREAAPGLVSAMDSCGPDDFAKSIMTTDSFPKAVYRTVDTPSGTVRVFGAAKGAGMICPSMATMLGTVLTDAAVDADWWRDTLRSVADRTFNAVTVDGDTSTNDCVFALANGASGVSAMPGTPEAETLAAAVEAVCDELAYLLVKDAEGGTKVLDIRVSGAKNREDAELAARTVGHSPLVKTAFYGKDANFGRIVAALGRSGADFDPAEVQVSVCGVEIVRNGAPAPGDLDAALAGPLEERDMDIRISLGGGDGEYRLRAADLTHEYVTINADYRT